ncbi:MAG: hypothetical protein L6R39_004044 [Caloplaca ligustica]|nr:MAG: hypothetical protein L6R39_004044 [Caloplaca ligustica]
MAAVAVPPDVTSRLEGEWNESQIESALARLQEMHAQLRYLRDAIPRLIDPLLTQQPSPEDLYNNFAANVTAIRSDVKNFSESFRDDEYRELLKKAEDIRAQSSEDIPAWRVTEHEDWLDVRNVASLMDIAADERNGADSDVNEKAITEPGYLRAAIGKFRKDNPSIEASLDENSRIVMVHATASWPGQ